MKTGLLCVLFSFIALSVGSALSESLTYDEVFYLEEGRRIVQTRTFSDPYNPPLSPLLGTIPGIFGFADPFAARVVTIVLGTILILAVYRVGGIVAAALLAFEPTFLGHSHYVTGDIAVTLFIFLAATLRRPLILGLSIGYALSSKMSSLVFLPLVLRRMRWRQVLGMAIVAFFVVWASYLFTWDVVLREREDAGRLSVRLVTYAREKNVPVLEDVVTFLRRQPLPLGTYIATMKNNALRIGKPAMVFFDGELYDGSRWYFMIVNILRKISIPFFILVLFGVWRARRFAAIAAGIIGIASVMGMVPLIRYVLPAIPLLALVAASGLRKKILVLFLLWHIVGTIAQYPHFISYANELAGPRGKRYEILADSNLDWGQALPDLVGYVKDRKLGRMLFSYFGRDDASVYGLASPTPYGGWKFEEICAFHDVVLDPTSTKKATVISVSNWYYCGYYKEEAFLKENIRDVVADVFLVFKKG